MMKKEIITSIRVNVKSFSLDEFWWSHYGFLPKYKDELLIQSEDKIVDYGAFLFMKGYLREHLNGDSLDRKAGEEVIGYWFGKSLEELLQEDRIQFSCYRKPQPIMFREISPPWLNGGKIIIPTGINFAVYNPAEHITYEAIDEAVRRFIREYAKIPFCEVKMINDNLSKEEVRRAYDEFKCKVAKSKDKKRELIFDPSFLALLVEPGEMARYQDIKFGIYGDDERLYVQLGDGSRHPIGKPRLEILKEEKD